MFSKAYNIIRSLRTSDAHTDEEKEPASSNLSIIETSPENSVIVDSGPIPSRVDKISDSNNLQHEFHTIQPRASIRTRSTNSKMMNETNTLKPGEELVIGGSSPHITHHNESNDIMIIDEIPLKKKHCGDNISPKRSKSISCKKELICVDEEEDGPLVMDIDDSPEGEYSNDSESSYHSAPQEIFDLCGPEPVVYTVNGEQKPKDEKVFSNFKVPCGVAPRSGVSPNSSPKLSLSTHDTGLQSNVPNAVISSERSPMGRIKYHFVSGTVSKTCNQVQSDQGQKILPASTNSVMSSSAQSSTATTKNVKSGENPKGKEITEGLTDPVVPASSQSSSATTKSPNQGGNVQRKEIAEGLTNPVVSSVSSATTKNPNQGGNAKRKEITQDVTNPVIPVSSSATTKNPNQGRNAKRKEITEDFTNPVIPVSSQNSATTKNPNQGGNIQRKEIAEDFTSASLQSSAKTKELKSGGNANRKNKKVNDFRLRLRLPISGTKKKRFFYLKISRLISMIHDKYHPLHKWKDLITLENVNSLSTKDIKKLVKILKDFVEVQVVMVNVNVKRVVS